MFEYPLRKIIITIFFLFFLAVESSYAQQPRLVLPIGKNNRSLSTTLSPDTKKLVAYDASNLISVWDAEKGVLLNEFRIPSQETIAVQFMNNNEEVIIVAKDSTLYIASIYSGKIVQKISLATEIWEIRISSDGKKILARGMNAVCLLDRYSGKELFSYADPFISGMAFSNNSHYFVITTSEQLFIHKTIDGSLVTVSEGSFNAIAPVFSRDDQLLFTANYQDAVLYAIPSGKITKTLTGHKATINYGLFHPEKKLLATCSDDSTVRIWNTVTGSVVAILGKHKGEVQHADFNKAGSQLVTTALDKTLKNQREIYTWDAATWKKKLTIPFGKLPINTARYSSDGYRLIIDFLYLQPPRITDAKSGVTIRSLTSSIPEISAAGYSKDGSKIYSLESGGKARIWDMKNADFVAVNAAAYHKEIYTGFFSPDLSKVIIPVGFGSVGVLDTLTQKVILKIDTSNSTSWAQFSPDGTLLLTASLLHDKGKFFGNNPPKIRDALTGRVIRELNGHTDGVSKAVFSDDGKLIATASHDSTAIIWNTTTGEKLLQFPHSDKLDFSSFSRQNKFLLTVTENGLITVWDIEKNKRVATISGGNEKLKSAVISPDFHNILVVTESNSIKLLNIETGKEEYQFFGMGSADFIIRTSDDHYFAGREAARQLYYVTKELQVVSFEQLDIKYNRPDKVLAVIGNRDTALIHSYRKAYEKRIKKLGVDTSSFNDTYGLPEANFTNRSTIAFEQLTNQLSLQIKGMDSTYNLDRFNVWVNESPVFGQRGISIKKKNKNELDTTIIIKLSQGENRIETSITNVNGTESYRMPLIVNYTPAVKQKETIRFIGIGIDQFSDSQYNLHYSVKDIRDLANKLKQKYGSTITIDTLFNNNVTISNVKALKQQLLQTSVNDKVIISYSGHGLLSKEYDYYLSTYAVNFNNPQENGLAYEELENLLDSIPARKKLMLIDACHSGEVDKEEGIAMHKMADSLGLIKGIIIDDSVITRQQLGLKNSFELMQSLFVNVGKSTGATIISAAAGNQFALERGDLKNGVFTYSLLEAMEKNKSIKISELKKIVGERVEQLTNGMQQPTSRNETIAVDWSL